MSGQRGIRRHRRPSAPKHRIAHAACKGKGCPGPSRQLDLALVLDLAPHRTREREFVLIYLNLFQRSPVLSACVAFSRLTVENWRGIRVFQPAVGAGVVALLL
jgi:hypothetical protein